MKESPPTTSFSNDDDTDPRNLGGHAGIQPRFTKRRQSSTIVRRSTVADESDSDAVEVEGWKEEKKQLHQDAMSAVSFLCGITAGVLQAGLFNPFDRALYLSITNKVPFLRRENFRNPYTGFLQSVGHRALSGGLYYPLENFFCSLLMSSHSPDGSTNFDNLINPHQQQQQQHSNQIQLHPAFANFFAGTLAGTTNAMIVNPVTAIKYKTWGREVNRGMVTETMEMFRKGGLRPFGNGMAPTILRDLCFGGTYTFLRLEIQYVFQLRPDQQWGANTVAAALATIVSAPFNLVRNVQYATRSREKADGISKVLQDFYREVRSHETTWERARYFQTRLRIGWGTVRVAVGMAFGHLVYDNFMGLYHDFDEERTREQRRKELERSLTMDD